MTVLSWAEKEKMVIELYKQGVFPKEIAHRLRMSLRDIYRILKPELGKKKTELTNELKLYSIGKRPVEVAIKLRLMSEEASETFIKYKELTYLGEFGKAYARIKGKIPEVLTICEAIQRKEITIDNIIRGFHFADELPEMESMHSAFTRTIAGFREELDFVISEKLQACHQLREVNSLIQQAQARLSSIISQKQNAEAELARIKNSLQAYNNQNQNNSKFPNYGYSNNYPY